MSVVAVTADLIREEPRGVKRQAIRCRDPKIKPMDGPILQVSVPTHRGERKQPSRKETFEHSQLPQYLIVAYQDTIQPEIELLCNFGRPWPATFLAHSPDQ
jgi:hypothetical protein